MLDLQHQKKLVEAISFFASHTKHCGLTKLFKLLYWLDYHHFRETGETVTGLSYQAFPYGPVPDSLNKELSSGHGSVADQFIIKKQSKSEPSSVEGRTIDDDDEGYALKNVSAKTRHIPASFTPHQRYQHRFLTRREQRIADRLAVIFVDTTAEQISDVSHARGGPWLHALKTGGERATIDFLGKLFPMTKGEYLSDENLMERAAELRAELENFV